MTLISKIQGVQTTALPPHIKELYQQATSHCENECDKQ